MTSEADGLCQASGRTLAQADEIGSASRSCAPLRRGDEPNYIEELRKQSCNTISTAFVPVIPRFSL
jgi:hypothetical protein